MISLMVIALGTAVEPNEEELAEADISCTGEDDPDEEPSLPRPKAKRSLPDLLRAKREVLPLLSMPSRSDAEASR